MTFPALAALTLQGQINPDVGVPLPPRWGWYVVLYFFIGGLIAGCYAIACTLDAMGDPRDREAVRLGYSIAFPGVLICAALLIVDLGRPERFWHMVIKSHYFPEPILKYWSPISIGSWVLFVFGAFAFISFMSVLIERGKIRWRPVVHLADRLRRLPHAAFVTWSILGAFFALFVGGYTGVLMVATVKPVWHNAVPLGGLFLASALSGSYALLILLLARRGRGHTDPTVAKLEGADRWALAVEGVLLLLVLVPLGALARPIVAGGFGALFWVGVVLTGLLLPVALDLWTRRGKGQQHPMLRAALILVGGLVLRFVMIMAPQWPEVRPWHL
ncbi:MAG TPA: NrfD/PsrC family molybdoenzyme membrane anchor subunit [Gemmatimonadales bacterium]|nr:NrfD/PsrC family molybdoenzyme membrane anchor subunit [Gemmatimonadales bacterium]